MGFIRTRVTCSLLVGVLFSGCAATEWLSGPGVELRECSAGDSVSAGGVVRPGADGGGVGSLSESELAEVRDSLFGEGDAGEFVESLGKESGDSARLVGAAAVVVDVLGDGEELSRDDRRTVNQVLGLVGPRGAFAALEKHVSVDRLQQVLDVGAKHGVGERFLSCAVIGEGLAGDERVVLDAVMKASAVERVSEDGREWLLAAMVARADEVFSTLSGEVGEVFGAFVRVGVGVTEGTEAQNRFVYALREAYRQAVTSPRAVEQPNVVYLGAARGVGAVVEVVTRGGQREEVPRMTVARTLTHYRYVYCAEYKQTSCPDLPDMSDAAADRELNHSERAWNRQARKGLVVVIVRKAPRSFIGQEACENFDKFNPIILDAVSKGERPPWATRNELYVAADSALRSRLQPGEDTMRPYHVGEAMTSRAEEAGGVIATMGQAS